MKVLEHIEYLGKEVKDAVTGFSGVVTSASFDLYGCVQLLVKPKIDNDGRIREGHWLDVTRLILVSGERVMELPNFIEGAIAEGKSGPAEKPAK